MSKKIDLPNKDTFTNYVKGHNREQTAKYFGTSESTIDRWLKQLHVPRKTFRYKEMCGFSKEQIEILQGSLLGDGCLQLVGRTWPCGLRRVNSKFTETHSLAQMGLLEWKMEKLQPFSTKITSKTVIGRKNIGGIITNDPTKILETCRLDTVAHPFFTEMEKKWYRRENGEYILEKGRRIKTLPDDLTLTPTVIAVWYYDDGSHAPSSRTIQFNTQSFSKQECERLAEQLKQFGISCGLGKNRDKYIIRVNCSSYLTLIDIVKDRLPSACIYYKIDLSKYRPPDYSTRFTGQGRTHRAE